MIRENVGRLRARISAACKRSNRDPASITVVAVSKGRSVEQIHQVIDTGITDIGENRVQEALPKLDVLRATNCELRAHMVGHLQTNKVKQAVQIFDLIHSVDSLRLAQEIDKQAKRLGKIQEILIQVSTSGEEAKFGLSAQDSIEAIKEIAKFKNINIKGLMTIAPLIDNPEEARPYFRQLRELRDSLRARSQEPRALSMGMTDDFEVAIEEGAEIIRVGRAIFEG